VTRGVLLGLPVHLLVFSAQSTLIPVSNLCDEPVVHLSRLETTREVHRRDLLWVKGAMKYNFVHFMLEYCRYPVGGKVAAPAFLANSVMELEWVGLKNSCWLSARLIVAAAS